MVIESHSLSPIVLEELRIAKEERYVNSEETQDLTDSTEPKFWQVLRIPTLNRADIAIGKEVCILKFELQ